MVSSCQRAVRAPSRLSSQPRAYMNIGIVDPSVPDFGRIGRRGFWPLGYFAEAIGQRGRTADKLIRAEQNEMGPAIAAEPIKNAQIISAWRGTQISDSNCRLNPPVSPTYSISSTRL